MSVTFPRRPARGARSSIAYFATSPQHWRSRPRISHEVILNLIANTTTTQAGLRIRADWARRTCPADIQITDDQFDALYLKMARFHGDSNYAFLPPRTSNRSCYFHATPKFQMIRISPIYIERQLWAARDFERVMSGKNIFDSGGRGQI